MHPAIGARLDDIIHLCKEHGVKRLEIFGSAARGDDFNSETSDVDFLVEFHEWALKPWMGEVTELREALQKAVGRPVDILSFGALSEMRNRFRRKTIEQDRLVVYAA